MSWVTGTATSHTDLFSKLLNFLQNDAGLVSKNQNWSVAWSAPAGAANASDVVLKGPGLAGSDSVFVGLRLNAEPAADRYSVQCSGLSSVLSTAQSFDEHANASPSAPRMFLSGGSMRYWFVANGRRFVCIVKISGVYEALYAGLVLPFSAPVEYPYPLYVGASAPEGSAATDWRAQSEDHTAFHRPYVDPVTGNSNAYILGPSGTWRSFRGRSSLQGDAGVSPDYFGGADFPFSPVFGDYVYGYADISDNIDPAFGGSYPLRACVLFDVADENETLGLLHGVKTVSGKNNVSENIVTVDSVQNLVIQNIFRASRGQYFTVALEA